MEDDEENRAVFYSRKLDDVIYEHGSGTDRSEKVLSPSEGCRSYGEEYDVVAVPSHLRPARLGRRCVVPISIS